MRGIFLILFFVGMVGFALPAVAERSRGQWGTSWVNGFEIKSYAPSAGVSRGQILLLHGCKQDAQKIISISEIEKYADALSLEIVVPSQNVFLNYDHCWNFFLPSNQTHRRGGAELEMLLALVKKSSKDHYLLGMSSGAAMALNLYYNHADLFKGVLIHSGLAYQSVTDVRNAQSTLDHGPSLSLAELINRAHSTHLAEKNSAPRGQTLLFIHGKNDVRVNPINTRFATEQNLGFFKKINLPVMSAHGQRIAEPHSYPYSLYSWALFKNNFVYELSIDSLAHAWSGGAAGYPNSDPYGPDVLRLFFEKIHSPELISMLHKG